MEPKRKKKLFKLDPKKVKEATYYSNGKFISVKYEEDILEEHVEWNGLHLKIEQKFETAFLRGEPCVQINAEILY